MEKLNVANYWFFLSILPQSSDRTSLINNKIFFATDRYQTVTRDYLHELKFAPEGIFGRLDSYRNL